MGFCQNQEFTLLNCIFLLLLSLIIRNTHSRAAN